MNIIQEVTKEKCEEVGITPTPELLKVTQVVATDYLEFFMDWFNTQYTYDRPSYYILNTTGVSMHINIITRVFNASMSIYETDTQVK